MVQEKFAKQAVYIVQHDPDVVGLAVGGSWCTQELDAFSDLDFVLVTRERVAGDKTKMLAYAHRFGDLLNAFTGEHVGEPRLLICLYNDPLLHVDIKFLTPDEFQARVEDPVLLHDPHGVLKKILETTTATFPQPGFQWIEDRFWTWVHYATLKIGRGEYFEALDFLAYLRQVVLGPLLHLKNGNLPRGVRKAETSLQQTDVTALKKTIAGHDRDEIVAALAHAIVMYQQLRNELFQNTIQRHTATEKRVLEYLQQVSGHSML